MAAAGADHPAGAKRCPASARAVPDTNERREIRMASDPEFLPARLHGEILFRFTGGQGQREGSVGIDANLELAWLIGERLRHQGCHMTVEPVAFTAVLNARSEIPGKRVSGRVCAKADRVFHKIQDRADGAPAGEVRPGGLALGGSIRSVVFPDRASLFEDLRSHL